MNRWTTEDIVEVVDFDGREWLYLRSIPVDVAIIRATTADEFGNLTTEDEGAPLGILDQALAAHNNGGSRHRPGQAPAPRAGRCPRRRSVSRGSWSTRSWSHPDQLQTTQTALLPEAAGHFRAPISDLELAAVGPREGRSPGVPARSCATARRSTSASASPRSCPGSSSRKGSMDAVTWVIEQGAVGGIPFLGFQFGCAQNPDALLPSPDQFTYLQGGGFDRALLSFLEVDAAGNVNVSRLDAKPARHGRGRRLRRHHRPRARTSSSPATSRPAPRSRSMTAMS